MILERFATIGIVVAGVVVVVVVETVEIIALMMVSMAAMYDHFVAVNQTISCCLSVVAEAVRLQSSHRDQLIIDAIQLSQCVHPINKS